MNIQIENYTSKCNLLDKKLNECRIKFDDQIINCQNLYFAFKTCKVNTQKLLNKQLEINK